MLNIGPNQHAALIQFAVDQAANGSKGTTNQMIYNCAIWFRKDASEHSRIELIAFALQNRIVSRDDSLLEKRAGMSLSNLSKG
jgi:hypothetical protein